jgi:leader peptidase (prepilin peptidase)/N-methyltransferase
MDTIRLLVCIALALPCGVLLSRLSATFVTERPLFQPSESPRVSQRTIVLESLTLATFVLLGWRFADASWFELLAYLAGFAALLLASAIDFTEYRLPDVVVLPTLAIGLFLVVILSVSEGDSARVRYAVLGAVIAFGALLVAHLISPKGMGFGDVKFAAVLGLLVGFQAGSFLDVVILVLWVFLIGFAFGALGGIFLLVVRGRNQPFPFGPFLAVGTLVTVLASRALVG